MSNIYVKWSGVVVLKSITFIYSSLYKVNNPNSAHIKHTQNTCTFARLRAYMYTVFPSVTAKRGSVSTCSVSGKISFLSLGCGVPHPAIILSVAKQLQLCQSTTCCFFSFYMHCNTTNLWSHENYSQFHLNLYKWTVIIHFVQPHCTCGCMIWPTV